MTGRRTPLAPSSAGAYTVDLEPYASALLSFDASQPALPAAAPAPAAPAAELPLPGPWTLTLNGETLPLARLESWTALPRHRFFSGVATYSTTLHLDAVPEGAALDLGEVRENAEVLVNGRLAGATWIRPHRLAVSALLRPGDNRIDVRVANLTINRVLGQPNDDYSGLPDIRFPLPGEKQAISEPLSSGLLGPVRLCWTKEARN
jgi:hypothetical protein